MSRSKKMGLMLAALAALIVIFVLVRAISPDETTEEERTSVFSLNADETTKLSWTYEEETISFVYEDNHWQYSGDEAFPLEENYISSMLSALSDVTASRVIESPEDLEQYGLDEPACEINVTAEQETTILIGDESSMGGSRYLSVGDGNVYLVDSSLLDTFSYSLYDIVEKEEIPSMNDVRSFNVESDGQLIEIEYDGTGELAYSDEYIWFLNGETALDTDLAYDLIESVSYMSWGDCVNYRAEEDDLAQYGLDEPQAKVTVKYMATEETEDGETRDVLTSFELEVGDYSGQMCYARLAGSEMIYLIDGSVADALVYADAQSLLPDEVIAMDWDKVTEARVTMDGQTYILEKTEESWEMDGEEISFADVTDALDSMTSSDSEEDATAEGTAQIAFVFTQDSENFPQVTLELYQYDSSTCLARLNGEARLLVADDTVSSLLETVSELFAE